MQKMSYNYDCMQNNLKIGICGAHGTGKTTVCKILSEQLGVHFITNTMRSMWQEVGVSDFEKLPSDVRALFQNHAILRQIKLEDTQIEFITDRTVLDNLSYTILSSNLEGSELELYKQLVIERLKNYTHIIYLPVLFGAKDEFLRANVETRDLIANIMESHIQKYVPKEKLLWVKSDILQERIEQIKNFLELVE